MPPRKESFLGRVMSTVTGKKQPALLVRSLDDPMIHLGRCCFPIKGEPVTGYITIGKGITVHSLRCPLVVKEVLDGQRMVDVAWDDGFKGSFKAKLLVKTEDSPGVLAKVATVISRLEGNITKAEVATFANKRGNLCLEMSIRDIRHLEAIFAGLAEIREIFSAERV
jgi:GTP pyrophosphokinase